MFFSRKLLPSIYLYPSGMNVPSSFTTQEVVNLSNTASYQIGTIASTGWYRVKIGAADGTGEKAGKGGYATKTFFAYNGSKYLIWGCNGKNTGYPTPSGSGGSENGILGGGGANGGSRTFQFVNPNANIITHGGMGGGSAAGNGATDSYSSGGAGCGFICGIDANSMDEIFTSESFSNSGFSVESVMLMVLAGGGAGSSSAGAGGGGAWGNGGHGTGWDDSIAHAPILIDGGTGPGGTTFGMGTDGEAFTMTRTSASGVTPATYQRTGGQGGNGAWCIRDFTTSSFTSGTGTNSRPAAQVCILEKLIY